MHSKLIHQMNAVYDYDGKEIRYIVWDLNDKELSQ